MHTDIGEARNRLSQPDHFDVCHRDAQLYVYVTPHELLHACTIRPAIEFHRSVRSVKVIVVETARANMQITLVYARIRGEGDVSAISIRRRQETRRPDYADRKRGITRLDLHSISRFGLQRT